MYKLILGVVGGIGVLAASDPSLGVAILGPTADTAKVYLVKDTLPGAGGGVRTEWGASIPVGVVFAATDAIKYESYTRQPRVATRGFTSRAYRS